VLGTLPVTGRLFGAADNERPAANPIVVLSHGYWKRSYGSDPQAVGRTIRLNGQSFTIVGVAPDGFQGMSLISPDLWVPLTMVARAIGANSILNNREAGWLMLGGRLKPGYSPIQAGEEIEVIGRALASESPAADGFRGLRLLPSSRSPGNRGLVVGFLGVLMILVSCVLAVACANVSGMLLARGASRTHEIAVRLAIGAGRARIVRQLLTETMLLFVGGGLLGLLFARLTVSAAIPLLPPLPFPVALSLALDWRVVAFTTGLSLVAAIVFGLAPALRTARTGASVGLKADRAAANGRSPLRSGFVVAQVAFSVALVVTALSFVRALEYAGSANPGFDARAVELATVDLSMGRYSAETGAAFWRALVERARQLPNVQSATLARVFPGGFEGIGLGGVSVPGVTQADGSRFLPVSWNIVEPGYFETLRIPLIAGRDFGPVDVRGGQSVAIVAESAARRFWPGRNAVGQVLYYHSRNREQPLLVVGVVGDVRSTSLIDGLADPFVYLPLQQHYASDLTSSMTLAVRSADGRSRGGDIRSLLDSMDPNLTIVMSQTLGDSTALGLVPQRIIASLAGTLGLMGLMLAGIGIYGVIAYSVSRRTREFGIRIALGAPAARIVRSVLWRGIRLTVTGVGIGFVLAAAVTRALAGFMFGLPPMHIASFAGAAALFGLAGLVAGYLPARRATRIDPSISLRCE
jgi:predicted permease